MRLEEILTEQRVTVRLDAVDKRSALNALAALLVADLEAEPSEVVRVFEEREALASTGVGEGVAVPHGTLPEVDSLIAAVGIVKRGVEFNAIDGRPAHILVGLVGPERARGAHLKALARFSRLLRHASVRARLLEAEGDREAFEIIVSEDGAR